MKFFSFLIFATASFAAASSIVSRQTYGTVWDDEIIPEPINFRIFESNDQCSFQLTTATQTEGEGKSGCAHGARCSSRDDGPYGDPTATLADRSTIPTLAMAVSRCRPPSSKSVCGCVIVSSVLYSVNELGPLASRLGRDPNKGPEDDEASALWVESEYISNRLTPARSPCCVQAEDFALLVAHFLLEQLAGKELPQRQA